MVGLRIVLVARMNGDAFLIVLLPVQCIRDEIDPGFLRSPYLLIG